MHQYIFYCICFLFNIKLSRGEHVHIPENCEGSSSVEHFFNVIFTEFQSFPPACVCVQICPDQPTYCYPNKCFKPAIRRKNENPISKIDGRKSQPVMFLVDQDKELLDIFDDESILKGRTERPLNEFILRPNPFKELVLKHKRLPKLEMRYNLREQVKNTKSDKLKADSINLSKTRWPRNKQVFHGKQPRGEIKHFKGNDDKRQTKFFASMFSGHEPVNYTPKYFKRYLTKRDNRDVNLEALYLYKTDSANFSLESLIDNMIENSLDDNTINAKLDLNIYVNNLNDSSTVPSRKVLRNIDNDKVLSTIKTKDEKVVLDVISLNSKNETVDRNRYDDFKVNVNKSIIDMIEKMSNEIEKQNNISFVIVEKVTGSKFDTILDEVPVLKVTSTPKDNSDEEHTISENITTTNVDVNMLDKEETSTTTFKPFLITKKIMQKQSKKRIIRRFRNRKP